MRTGMAWTFSRPLVSGVQARSGAVLVVSELGYPPAQIGPCKREHARQAAAAERPEYSFELGDQEKEPHQRWRHRFGDLLDDPVDGDHAAAQARVGVAGEQTLLQRRD